MNSEETIENLKRVLKEAEAHEEAMRLNFLMARASADTIRAELKHAESK